MSYQVKNGKLVRSFVTNNSSTIALVERALKAAPHGGYITFKGKPITVTALHYSRVLGTVQVKVEYVRAIRHQ